jgi:chromosome segregation ATPase
MTGALIALLALSASTGVQSVEVSANPVRRVVTLLQNLQKKVEAEGETDEDLHKKYLCFCETGVATLEKSIADTEANAAELAAAGKAAGAQAAQLTQDLAAHKTDRANAEEAIATATSVRAKEAATFATFKAESEANIGAIEGAVASLEKGMAGAFLQTATAQKLLKLVQSKDNMLEADREDITAFLQGTNGDEYAPQSGQITGILKTLHDEMTAALADATATEDAAIKSFDELIAAKKSEINALTAAIEDKSTRLGETNVGSAHLSNDGGDAADSLEDDKKYLADMKASCATAQKEYDALVATRNEELLALADTIKILNDDDALELFKKTLPSASASFMQIKMTSNMVRARALAIMHAAHQPGLNFITMALHGKKMGMDKVVTMIDEMVVTLKKEQEDDDKKKVYCAAEFDSSDDKKKALERSVSDAQAAIDDAEESLATLTSEIQALQKAIRALDKSVADATEQRKEENTAYTELMASNTAAKELIGVAKNRMNKFYNPKMYKAAPKAELTEEQRIAVSMGETLAPTPAPGGIAGTGITAFVQVSAHDAAAPAEAPEKPKYAKKGEESQGALQMMDLLVKDLDKEMTVGTAEEKDAQADYEKMMQDSAQKRSDDSKSLEDKQSAKADTEAALQGHKDDHASSSTELMETNKYISSLHGECDWLVENFEARKEARAGEVDALGKAKAVLSGADFSLLQTRSRSLRGHM